MAIKKLSNFINETPPITIVVDEIEILNEDRTPKLKEIFKDKLSTAHDTTAKFKKSDEIVDHFTDNADPTTRHVMKDNQPTGERSGGNYTQWILGQYKKGHIRQEDAPRIKDTLTHFEKHKSKLANKDINQYKHIADVTEAVEPHLGTVSKKEEVRQVKSEGADLVHDDEHIMVHRLKTKEAACHYGAGTQWCTAADNHNMFDHYNQQGPLYVIRHKAENKKYQFHFESGQFADERDRMIPPKDLVKKMPSLRNVPEFKEKSLAFNSKDEAIEKIKNIEKQPLHIKREVANIRSLSELD